MVAATYWNSSGSACYPPFRNHSAHLPAFYSADPYVLGRTSTIKAEARVNIKIGNAVLAGVVGTAVMTGVGLWVAPLMGLPPMNPAAMLAGAMGGVLVLGWMAHFMIGTVLAGIYAVVAPRLAGPPIARGALFGIAPFLLAQLMVMPMMGMPVFSGSLSLAMGSLVGHLVYGAVVGTVYGEAQASVTAPRQIQAQPAR
jgi:uncharacterized membrane protein YagU involved in acid resistance